MAEILIERVRRPPAFELTGGWPVTLGLAKH
jgi:hypothetical protein